MMDSDDSVLPIPICHALPLMRTGELVKQVDALREVNKDLA